MPYTIKLSAAAILCIAGLAGAAGADAEMDLILDEAMPYMHHSCESVIVNYGEDEEKVAEIVRLMVAVSLYNRQIDVVQAVPDEDEREQLKVEFIEALKAGCDDDPGALLAGAVDTAVKDALD